MFCVLDVLYLFGLCCCCLFLEASVYYQWIFLSFAIANFLKLHLSFAYRWCYSWVSIQWLTHGQLTLMTSGSFRWPCKINKHCLSVYPISRSSIIHITVGLTHYLYYWSILPAPIPYKHLQITWKLERFGRST